MAGVNKAIILGNLGRDPEMTYTPSGLAVCKFSIATSRKGKDGQDITQWHRCTAFGKAGELISQYVSKGNQLYIEGEINYSQYEKDGVTRYSTDIIVREFNFIGGGGGGGGQQSSYQGNQQGGGGYQGGGAPQGGGYQGGGAPQGGGGAQAQSGGYQGNAGYQQGGAPQSNGGHQGGGSGGGTPPKDDIPF